MLFSVFATSHWCFVCVAFPPVDTGIASRSHNSTWTGEHVVTKKGSTCESDCSIICEFYAYFFSPITVAGNAGNSELFSGSRSRTDWRHLQLNRLSLALDGWRRRLLNPGHGIAHRHRLNDFQTPFRLVKWTVTLLMSLKNMIIPHVWNKLYV